MAVSDGQKVDAATTNASYVDKNTAETFTVAKLDLQNPEPESGSDITNSQRELNAQNSYTGKSVNVDKDIKPAWNDNTTGLSTDSLKDRSDLLTTEVNTNRTNIATNTGDIAINTQDIQDTKDALGLADGETDMGIYPGSILTDSSSQTVINTELEAAIEALPSGLVFKGNWNADTNTPALADSGVGGVEGDYYIVSVAGTTTIDGISDWGTGDWIVNVDTKWDKIDNSETVNSVNGQTGTVVLDTDDISEGVTNEYYTNAKADARIALASIDDLSDVDTTTSAPSVDDVLKWDGSDWVPGVGGGGGQGGINYLTGDDTNFEGGTVGNWSLYNDGAATEPVDGTGGVASGNVTWVATNSDLLRGDWLGNFNAIATNNQGEGISVDFTIDKADWNKSLYLSYDVYTGGNWAADHVLPFIYDVDAATLVPLSRSGASDRFTGRFSTNGTSLNYRLILHIASSDTRNFTHAIDNVQIGPDKILDAPVITEWESFTPTGTWTTNSTYTGQYRRVGDTAEINIKVALSGAPNSTQLLFDMPPGLTIDGSKVETKSDESYRGIGQVSDPGSALYQLSVHADPIANVLTPVLYNHSIGSYTRGSGVTQAVPMTFASNDAVLINISLPIEEWANQSALISTTETLNETVLVDTLTFRTPTGTISAAWNKTQFSAADIENDELGLFNDSTDQIKIPETGRYSLPALIQFNGTPAGDSFVRIYNVTQSKVLDIGQVAGVTGASVNMSAQTTGKTWVANKNDLIEIQTFSFLTTPTYAASATGSHFSLISHNQLSVYGLYGETEYKSVELATNYLVVSNDTWESATGMSLNLGVGEWDIGFDASMLVEYVAGGSPALRGSMCLYNETDSSRFDDTIGATYPNATGSSTADSGVSSVSRSTRFIANKETTIRLQARGKVDANTSVSIGGNSITGSFTDPDNASILWARRIK